MPSVVLHASGVAYNDELFQTDNTTGDNPTIVGGNLDDASDATYIQVEHTPTSSSYGAATLDVWSSAPASYTVTHAIARYRYSTEYDDDSFTTWYPAFTLAAATYADPDPIFPDPFLTLDPVILAWPDDITDINDVESLLDQDAVDWNGNGVQLSDLGQMAEDGAAVHFYIASVAGTQSTLRLYEMELEIFYTEDEPPEGAISTIDSSRGGVVFIPMPPGTYTVVGRTVNDNDDVSIETSGISVTVV